MIKVPGPPDTILSISLNRMNNREAGSWRHDPQHNDIQPNDTQQNIKIIVTLSITYSAVMLNVIHA